MNTIHPSKLSLSRSGYSMLIQSTIEHLPIADNSIDLIFTDPPYPKDYLPCYEWLAKEAFRILKPNGFVIAMCGGMFLNEIYRYFDGAGLDYYWELYQINWGRDSVVIWPRHIQARVKPMVVYSKGKGALCRAMTIGSFEAGRFRKDYHHWGQDVESARYYIDCFSGPGQLVLDPFIGGGTTAVACELIGRRWIGCDIDPKAIETSALRLSGAKIPKQANMLL